MCGAVEEVGVSKGNMAGACFHLLPNVRKNDLFWNPKEFSSIDRRNRAVGAEMFAPSGCFHVSGRKVFDPVVEVGVFLQREEGLPKGDGVDLASGRDGILFP